MPKSNTIKTALTKARDTKGTFVYKNDSENAPIQSLYIRKSAFTGDAPEEITLTIEEK